MISSLYNDQVRTYLAVFTIAVVAANFFLLIALIKRVRKWTTLTQDLINTLTDAVKSRSAEAEKLEDAIWSLRDTSIATAKLTAEAPLTDRSTWSKTGTWTGVDGDTYTTTEDGTTNEAPQPPEKPTAKKAAPRKRAPKKKVAENPTATAFVDPPGPMMAKHLKKVSEKPTDTP